MSNIKIDHNGNVIHNGTSTPFDKIVYQEVSMLKTVGSDINPSEDVIDKNLSSISLIKKPVITAPNSGTVGFSGDIVLDAFTAKDDSYDGPHTSTDWEFATDFQFTNIVHTSMDDVNNLTSIHNFSVDDNTMMYARARYISNEYISHWSTPVAYRTNNIAISTPNILLANEGLIGRHITLILSSFTVTGGSDTLANTDWVIATDNLFNNIIYSSYDDTINKAQLDLPVTLEYNTNYYIKVRQKGNTYSSEWGYRTILTTNTVETPVISVSSGVASVGTLNGSISNYESDQSYFFTVTEGTITNNGDGTFTYNAPEAPGTDDKHIELKVMATRAGAVNSDYSIVNITVFHAGYFADDVMINLDFSSNVVYNDGFNL